MLNNTVNDNLLYNSCTIFRQVGNIQVKFDAAMQVLAVQWL